MLLKWGIVTGCALKIMLMQNLVSVTSVGDAKFYLESKALFIDISRIASFELFLIAWLREYCTFLDSSVILALAKIHPVGNYLKKKINRVSLSSVFFFFKYVLGFTVLV